MKSTHLFRLAAALVSTLAFTGCIASAEDDQPEDPGDLGTSSEALSTTTGTTFELTYYWVSQRPKNDPNEVTLRDCNGNFLTYASRAWRESVQMEMTGRFVKSDGTVVTFNDDGGCWKVLPASQSWGIGVSSPYTGLPYKLRPFRSIAVDPSVLRIGKWYYVKELDGVVMPYPSSGLVHDGCVRAVDESWSFSGRQIDLFAALKSSYETIDNGTSKLAGRTSVTMYSGTVKCAQHIEQGY
jgi:3D (Asp-Asp-Asp) domain-containing protein